MRVLEIGTHSGYSAAVMAEIVGADGQVTTMDDDPDIAEHARAHLTKAGYGDVHVVQGDGFLGCPEDAPFDRIVTMGVLAWELPNAWTEQLAEDGLMVPFLPLNLTRLYTALRNVDGRLEHGSTGGERQGTHLAYGVGASLRTLLSAQSSDYGEGGLTSLRRDYRGPRLNRRSLGGFSRPSPRRSPSTSPPRSSGASCISYPCTARPWYSCTRDPDR